MKDSINFSNKSEIVEINKAESRILSKDIIANLIFLKKTTQRVDGYALNFKKNNKIFNVVGQSRPSSPYLKTLKTNEAIKIFTGSNLKKNKINAVVMLEDCKILTDSIKIKKKSKLIKT